jgi:hypothetical protein
VDWATAREVANNCLCRVAVGDFSVITVAATNTRVQVELAFAKLQNMEVLAVHMQGQLGLESPWTIGGEEYNLYKEEAALGRYREALGELEGLVVMRLFELTKLSLSSTG